MVQLCRHQTEVQDNNLSPTIVTLLITSILPEIDYCKALHDIKFNFAILRNSSVRRVICNDYRKLKVVWAQYS